MAEALESFELGDFVVYLDGQYWLLGARGVRFEGYFATHDLVELPHATALRGGRRRAPPRLGVDAGASGLSAGRCATAGYPLHGPRPSAEPSVMAAWRCDDGNPLSA